MVEVGRYEHGAAQRLSATRDRLLIAEYLGGRREAFDDVVRAYDPTVRRLLARLSVSATEVDDLAQDVFVRVFRNLHRFRAQSSFSTWLHRITVNVYFDHNKKRKRAERRMQRLHEAFIDASHVRPQPHDPFRATLERLTNESFSRAVATLPEPYRDVVAMREVQNLSYEEIALHAGISVGTVRSRLSRARARLRQLLRNELSRHAGTAA